MTPSNALLDAIATRIATDTGTLANATDGCMLHLATNPFTSGPELEIADFTEATFDGYAALEAEAGAQMFFVDPTTGQRIIQLNEPAGGWHWETTGTTDLPQTITGAYLTDNGGTVLYGMVRFGTGITLTASNQGVDLGQARFALETDALI